MYIMNEMQLRNHKVMLMVYLYYNSKNKYRQTQIEIFTLIISHFFSEFVSVISLLRQTLFYFILFYSCTNYIIYIYIKIYINYILL